MTSPELIQYAKDELAKGSTRELISGKIRAQGWTDLDILEVFNIINQQNLTTHSVQPSIQKEEPEPSSLDSNPFHQFLSQNRGVGVKPITTNPAMMNVPSINTPSLSQPQQGKKSNKFLIYIIILILLIVGGGVAYASGYFVSPSKLFSSVLDSSKNNKTVSFDVNINIDGSQMKIPEDYASLGTDNAKTASFNMTGSFDMTNSEKLKFDTLYNFKMGTIEAGINLRAVNDLLYLNLTKGPNLGFFSLAPFENKWIAVPMKNKEGKLDTGNPLFSASPVDSDFINNMTEEQKQHITDMTNKARFIKITKKHLPEMIDGSLSYYLSFDLDKEGIVSYLKEMTSYLKSIDKDNIALASFDTEDYEKSMKAINSFNGELWIGIFDNLPHKILIDGDIINPEKPEDGSVKVVMSMIYKDWNKPVLVEIPANSMTFEELMKQVMGGMFGGDTDNSESNMPDGEQPSSVEVKVFDPLALEAARNKGEDASIKSIISNIRAQAELFHDSSGVNSYKGFCSSKTNGAYTNAIRLPKGSIYKCNDTITSWAAWVKLSTNEYFCVDNNGTAIASIKLPTGTTCPKQ